MPGATNFPTAVDNNVELTDGIDIIQADDQNHSYVAIDAIETFIGSSGKPQSGNTDILNFIREMMPTIRLSFKDVDTVEASAGNVFCMNSTASIRALRRNDAATDVTFSDIDAGARALSTDYYVYAVADAASSEVAFKISTNSSAPVGSVTYFLIGGFSTNATGVGEIIEKSVWAFGGFRIININSKTTGDQVTGATAIPTDDSIPQISEGVLLVELDHFVKSAASKLLILSVAHICEPSNLGEDPKIGIFVVGTNDALGVGSVNDQTISTNMPTTLMFPVIYSPGSGGKRVFQLRGGMNGATTFAMNGANGGRKMGGKLISGIFIIEFE